MKWGGWSKHSKLAEGGSRVSITFTSIDGYERKNPFYGRGGMAGQRGATPFALGTGAISPISLQLVASNCVVLVSDIAAGLCWLKASVPSSAALPCVLCCALACHFDLAVLCCSAAYCSVLFTPCFAM